VWPALKHWQRNEGIATVKGYICTAVFSSKLARPNYTKGYPVLDE
jgi:hypothetical protein